MLGRIKSSVRACMLVLGKGMLVLGRIKSSIRIEYYTYVHVGGRIESSVRALGRIESSVC